MQEKTRLGVRISASVGLAALVVGYLGVTCLFLFLAIWA